MNIFTLMGTILVDNTAANNSISATGQQAEGLAGKLGTGLANAAKIAGAAMLAIGTAAVGMAVKAVGASDECQKALNTLQTQTGATSEEMNGLKESLLSIYSGNYGESFKDVAQALANVKQQTGLAGQELEEFTTHALVLRDTFEMEVTESTRAADMMMKQFGVTGEEAFNLIAQGAQNGLDKNGNLLDSINEYSVHFSQLGLDAEDMFNMMSNGAEKGVFDYDKLGDAVKEFGVRAKDGSKSTMQAFTDLGLNAEELTSKFAGGGKEAEQAFQQVNEALANCDDKVLQNQVGVAIWGTMWEDMGVEATLALTNTKGVMDQTKATMESIKEIKYDSFGEAMEGIGRQIETGILVPLGDSLMPLLNDFANWINEHMPQIQEVMAVAMDGVKIAVEAAGKVFETLYNTVQNILPVLQQLAPVIAGVAAGFAAFKVITTVSSLFTTLSGIVATVSAAITAAGGVTAALGAAIGAVASPIVIAVAAIGALVAALVYLYNNNEDVRNALNQCWEAIKQLFSSAVEAIKGVINTFVEAFKVIWSKYGTDIQEIIQKVWDYIGQIFKIAIDLITDIFNVFSAAFQGDWAGMWEAVKELVSNLWNNITDLLKAWLDLLVVSIVNIGHAMLEAGKSIFTKLKEGITQVWNTIMTWINQVKQDPVKTITGIATSMFNAGKEIFNSLLNGLKNVWKGIESWVSEKVEWITGKVKFWDNSNSKMDKGKVNGSHAGGINSIPYDGYLAELHKGEMVLSASENNADKAEERTSSSGTQINIVMNYPQVNSTKDIKTISRQLKEQISQGDRALGLA